MLQDQVRGNQPDLDHLLRYVEGRDQTFAHELGSWMKSSERFRSFVKTYGYKVQAKLRGAANPEALKDVRCEFEIAYLLCKDKRFIAPQYEKYGKKGPDFTVTHQSETVFNVEVTRIQESEEQRKFDEWKTCVKESVPHALSPLWLSLHIDRLSDSKSDLLTRLRTKKLEIIRYILDQALPMAEEEVRPGRTKEYPVPGFEREIILEFGKYPRKQTDRLEDYGGSYPIFKTGKEFAKFNALYDDKLSQIVEGMINVLVIVADSKTRDQFALRQFVESFNRIHAERDEQECSKRQYFSGILLRGYWSILNGNTDNKVWNTAWTTAAADYPVPEVIREALSCLVVSV